MLTGRHIMIDLETLGTSTQSIILQIGACEFYPHTGEITRFFNRYISMASALAAGRTLDPDTILYWMEQENEARLRMVDGLKNKAIPLSQALFELSDFMQVDNGRQGLGRRTAKPDGVWSHGLTFDIPIVQESLAACGIQEPFDFWNCLDTRTIFKVANKRLSGYEEIIAERWPAEAPPRVKHCALSDAVAQAIAISDCSRLIGRID